MAEDNPTDLTAPKLPGKPFVKGDDPRRNLKGRPEGSVSITTAIKRKLKKVPKGQRSSYLELLVNRIFKQAIQDGNEQMIKLIVNYVDGMPIQPNLNADIDVNEIMKIYKPEKYPDGYISENLDTPPETIRSPGKKRV